LYLNRKICTKVTGSNLQTATFSSGILQEQKSMALAVQHLDWVMFWSDTDTIDPIWIGRAVVCSKPDWERKCWFRNKSGKTLHKFGSGKITLKPGDVAINIQWYKRLGGSAVRETDENVKYVIWEGEPVCQNAIYLLSSSFNEDMVLLGGRAATTAYCRRVRNGSSDHRIGYGGKDYKNYTSTETNNIRRLQKETRVGSTKQYFVAMARIDTFCLS
jgi:hypothetical protein